MNTDEFAEFYWIHNFTYIPHRLFFTAAYKHVQHSHHSFDCFHLFVCSVQHCLKAPLFQVILCEVYVQFTSAHNINKPVFLLRLDLELDYPLLNSVFFFCLFLPSLFGAIWTPTDLCLFSFRLFNIFVNSLLLWTVPNKMTCTCIQVFHFIMFSNLHLASYFHHPAIHNPV